MFGGRGGAARPTVANVVGEFSVRVDFGSRAIDISCASCGDTTSVDLSEPGFARVLAMFASRHRHAGPAAAPRLSVVPDGGS